MSTNDLQGESFGGLATRIERLHASVTRNVPPLGSPGAAAVVRDASAMLAALDQCWTPPHMANSRAAVDAKLAYLLGING